MKKRIVCVLLSSVFALTAFSACSKTEQADNTEKNTEKSIAIITPSADHGWTAGVTYYAEQRCEELGLDYKTYQSSNVNEQANDIQDALTAGCSAVVMLPHNDEVSIPAQAIVDEDIPLIVFDRKIDVDYDAYISGDNASMGTSSADVIGEKLNGTGIVAVENVPSSGSVSTERVDAFKAEMAEKYPNIKLVDFTADGFSQEEGLIAASDLLTANSNIDAIFSIDDESSIGFIQAIKEAGRTDVKIISGGGGCQDYFELIQSEENMQLFTATYSPIMMKDAVDLAVASMNGEEIEKDTIISTTIVNKDNAKDFIDANSPY